VVGNTAKRGIKKYRKKFKKSVDKPSRLWYSIKAVSETAKQKQRNTANLENKTVYSNPENS
jgi:hypothetical protein